MIITVQGDFFKCLGWSNQKFNMIKDVQFILYQQIFTPGTTTVKSFGIIKMLFSVDGLVDLNFQFCLLHNLLIIYA